MTQKQLDTMLRIEERVGEAAEQTKEPTTAETLWAIQDEIRNLYRRVSGEDPWEGQAHD